MRCDKLDFTKTGPKGTVVIVSCGSFSPPTLLHIRIMEDARDELITLGYHVAGGFISPVHSGYGKKSLVEMHHRVNMCESALESSDWMRCDPWECTQEGWTKTALVLRRFQQEINSTQPGARVM